MLSGTLNYRSDNVRLSFKKIQVGLVDNYYRQISQNYQSIWNYFKKFGMLTKLK